MHKGKFVTAINCMDGRTQLPVINWLKSKYSVDYVDMITEPGPDKILTLGSPQQVESIKSRVLISVNAHGSDTIAVVSHHDCAGNPVNKDVHSKQAKECLNIIRSWNLPIKNLVALWVDDNWSVEVIN